MTAANDNRSQTGACPICRKPAEETYRPFCSKRCADIDLGRWLGGTYAIPAVETDEPDEDEAPPARRPGGQDE
jgi:endogenous inhibitor of DNA gyrase (YacG/DUF329 family)